MKQNKLFNILFEDTPPTRDSNITNTPSSVFYKNMARDLVPLVNKFKTDTKNKTELYKLFVIILWIEMYIEKIPPQQSINYMRNNALVLSIDKNNDKVDTYKKLLLNHLYKLTNKNISNLNKLFNDIISKINNSD